MKNAVSYGTPRSRSDRKADRPPAGAPQRSEGNCTEDAPPDGRTQNWGALLLQRIPDLGEQVDLARPGGRGRLLGLGKLRGEPVHIAHHQEDDEGKDEEIDHARDKGAKSDHIGPGLARRGKRGARRHLARKHDIAIRKVDIAEDRPDDRHDDLLGERGDDRAEGAADDHPDSKIDDIAPGDEGTKFRKHGDPPDWLAGLGLPRSCGTRARPCQAMTLPPCPA